MKQVTRTWSVPTSPRNPYKIANELKLLSTFKGKIWNKKTQLEFAMMLPSVESFEGVGSKAYSDFSARDRINRAPKSFGFVRFDKDRIINITGAGKQLMAGTRIDELFLRQLLKWQYPSPNHADKNYSKNFCIKPFLEVLRIINALGGITKYELAIFCIPLLRYSDTAQVIQRIKKFRKSIQSKKSNIERKKYIKNVFCERFLHVYQEDVALGNFRKREGIARTREEFINTKIGNSKDYADAAIRYFRATGLFSISTRTYRLILKDEKKEMVNFLLSHTNPMPKEYLPSPGDFLTYLGAADAPKLPQDDKKMLLNEIQQTIQLHKNRGIVIKADSFRDAKRLKKSNVETIKDYKDRLIIQLEKKVIQKSQDKLKDFRNLGEIMDVFNKINERAYDEIPDRPLFFEWNMWRAFSLLDDGDIKGNLKIDSNGAPVNTAIGNMPDMECYYKDFVLVIEVTLSSGQRQYETEGEPVSRHVAQVAARLKRDNDKRPVYGLFIASYLNPSAIAHFYIVRQTNVKFYGGKIKIIPLQLNHFLEMMKHAGEARGIKSVDIYKFVKWADNQAESSSDESEWYDAITRNVSQWTRVN